MNHFHIKWSGGSLDWEPFRSRAEAETGARQLKRLGETFTIEEHDQSCQRCRDALNAKRRLVSGKIGEQGTSAD